MLGRRPIKEARLALPKRNGAADCLQPATSPATATAMRAISREATGRCEDRKAVPEVVVAEAVGSRGSHRRRACGVACGPSQASWPPSSIATDGRPQQWRMLEELDGATTDAIVFAVARGWMIVEAGHSICLTDAGRRLMESHA